MAVKSPKRLVTFSIRISGVWPGSSHGAKTVELTNVLPLERWPGGTAAGPNRPQVPDFTFVHNRVTVRCTLAS